MKDSKFLRKSHTIANIEKIEEHNLIKNMENPLLTTNNNNNPITEADIMAETNDILLKRTLESNTVKQDENHESLLHCVLVKEKKTLNDAKIIYDYVKDLAFFNNFKERLAANVDDDAMIELYRSLKYEKLPRGVFVFKEGDISNDKLYIILSGSVIVFKNKNSNIFHTQNIETNQIEDNQHHHEEQKQRFQNGLDESLRIANKSPSKKEVKSQDVKSPKNNDDTFVLKSLKSSIQPKLKKQQSQNLSNAMEDNKIKSSNELSMDIISSMKAGFKIDTLTKGEMFGDKALTSKAKNPKRSTSIYTQTPCEFLVLLKEDISFIMKKYDKEKQEKYKYIKDNIPFLDGLAPGTMDDYFYKFKDERFTVNSKLTKEGDINDKIYFIYEGECVLSKEVHLHDFHDLCNTNINSNPNAFHIDGVPSDFKPNNDGNYPNEKQHSDGKYSDNKLKDNQRSRLLCPVKTNILITKAGKGTIIGDEIIYDKTKKYKYTTTVITSELIAFSFTKRDFIEWLPFETKKELKRKFNDKQSYHLKKLNKTIQKRIPIIIKQNQCDKDIQQYVNCLNLTHSSCKSAFISQLKRNRPCSFANDRQDMPIKQTKPMINLAPPENTSSIEIFDTATGATFITESRNFQTTKAKNKTSLDLISVLEGAKQVNNTNNISIMNSCTPGLPSTKISHNKRMSSVKERPQILTSNNNTQSQQSLHELLLPSERGISTERNVMTMTTISNGISRKLDYGIINYLDNVKKLLKLDKKDPCKDDLESEKFDFGNCESELEIKRRNLLKAKRLNIKIGEENEVIPKILKTSEDMNIHSKFKFFTNSKKKTEFFTKSFKKYLNDKYALTSRNDKSLSPGMNLPSFNKSTLRTNITPDILGYSITSPTLNTITDTSDKKFTFHSNSPTKQALLNFVDDKLTNCDMKITPDDNNNQSQKFEFIVRQLQRDGTVMHNESSFSKLSVKRDQSRLSNNGQTLSSSLLRSKNSQYGDEKKKKNTNLDSSNTNNNTTNIYHNLSLKKHWYEKVHQKVKLANTHGIYYKNTTTTTRTTPQKIDPNLLNKSKILTIP